MTVFSIAFAWTAIPIVALSTLSALLAATTDPQLNNNPIPYVVWFVAAALWLFAIIMVVLYKIGNRREIARGVLAGIAIGILALGTTCGVNIALALAEAPF